jgi:ketosteroid isomerase-like protein
LGKPGLSGGPAMSRQSLLMILLMTLLMGLVLSAVFTLQDGTRGAPFLAAWLARFAATYIIVLPTVLVVAPAAQYLSGSLERALSRKPAPEAVALAAWRANAAGHAGKGFGPWLSALAEDVSVSMPVGAFRGETRGKAAVSDLYKAIEAAEPRLVYEEPLRVTASGTCVVIEFSDHGTIAGIPYRNRIAASFDIEDGKVLSYREYFGDIDPEIVRLMSAAT